jgi:hypothetical protein
MSELLLFISAFGTVFAIGFQSLNVNNGHHKMAFLTSYLIGVSHLVIYRVMPDPSLTEIVAYLNGGPFGIVASMYVHQKFMRRDK